MNPKAKLPSALAALLLLFLTGCGASCTGCTRDAQPAGAPAEQPKSAPAAPAAEPAPMDAEQEEGEGRAPPPAPPAGAAAERMLDLPDGTRTTLKGADDAQRVLIGELDRSLRLGSLDCAGADQRRGAICEIAKRICALVEGDPNRASTPDTIELCSDSKERCGAAQKRYDDACAH